MKVVRSIRLPVCQSDSRRLLDSYLSRFTSLTGLLLAVACILVTVRSGYGQCDSPFVEDLGYADLNVNAVRARLTASATHFSHGVDEPHYEIPAGSGIESLWFSSVMVGGVVGDVLGIIGNGQGETWPGPLDAQGNPPEDCSLYDHVYRVSLNDLNKFEETGIATPDMLNWPWYAGAPVADGDWIEGNYDLPGGDRPAIDGHEMLWWVVNDKTSSNWPPQVGLEIQVSAFAAESADPVVNNATLYHYRLTHHGSDPLTDAYFGMYVRPALGNNRDHFVGADTALGLAYIYNRDDFSEDIGSSRGYGSKPPALGYVILEGIRTDDDGVDNDEDGAVDEADERLPMSKFITWGGDGTVTGRPNSDEDYYNYLSGRWRDGVPVTYGGSGRGWTETPVDFMYPGEPPDYWSAENVDAAGYRDSGGRDFIWSTGPFSMEVGESREIVVAILWAQGEDRYDSIRKLKEAVPPLRAYWNDGFHIPRPAPPASAPNPLAPADGAIGQPTNTAISWHVPQDPTRVELQVSTDGDFETLVDSVVSLDGSFDLELGSDVTYFWRIRTVNAGGQGPWSEPWSFETGARSLKHPGTLDIDGKGSWAFIQVQGIGDDDACGPGAESTFGCAEFGGNFVYGSPNGAGDWMMYHSFDGPESTLPLFAPRDYEIRFTEEGSYAYNFQSSSRRIIWVPLETWDIGPTGPFGVNDPADDEQLITAYLSNFRGDCLFGFGEYDDPLELGWPATDRVFAYYVTPGNTYADWEAAVKPMVEAHVHQCPTFPATDAPAEEFIDLWSAGSRRPLQNLIFMMDPASPHYRPEGIPVGNVIRFLTTKPEPPIPSAPIDNGTLPENDLSIWWQTGTDTSRTRVQIGTGDTFARVLVDTLVSGDNLRLSGFEAGETYSWRLSHVLTPEAWSPAFRFTVVPSTPTENDQPEFPSTLTLMQPYPNPTARLAHFDVGLPETGRVTLTAYDLLGRQVANIADAPMTAGWRTVDWNTAAVSNGVYVVRLQAGGTAVSRKVVVVR